MKLDLKKSMLLASLRISIVSMGATVVLTYIAILIVGIRNEDFNSNIGTGLGIAVSIALLVSFPVSNIILQQGRSLELANKKLLNLIRYDQLTGLLSRATFFCEVEKLQKNRRAVDQYDAVFFMDLDYFKKINDQYGHAAGDEVLRRFGAVVSKQLQEGELASRLGGEEFALFITNCTPEQAEYRAEKLARMFAREVVEFNGVEIRCTVSIGVYAENSGKNLDAMLSKADELLYKAKQSGRNRVVSRSVSRLAA